MGDNRPLSGPDQVMLGSVGLDHYLGPGRNGDLQRVTIGAVALRSLPVDATLGLEVRLAAEVLEVAVGVVADEHDVPAAAAVAAVGTALGYVRLTAEAHATVAATAGLYVDVCCVFHLRGF